MQGFNNQAAGPGQPDIRRRKKSLYDNFKNPGHLYDQPKTPKPPQEYRPNAFLARAYKRARDNVRYDHV